MADRIIEAYWDCPYCGNKEISGLTKNCPSCGYAHGEGIKFYIKKGAIRYLNPEESKVYGKGADWKCDSCGCYNRYNVTECVNCGSPRSDSKLDYFGRSINNEKTSGKNDSATQKNDSATKGTVNRSITNAKEETAPKDTQYVNIPYPLVFLLLALVGVITFLAFIFSPREYKAKVSSNSWERLITIESYEWVDDTSWYDSPTGARDVSFRNEIHHYDSVLDHYETETVQRSREVYDYTEYEEHVSYSDNGDGTYTEHTYTTSHPVYRTEYYTEEVQKPVYVSVPVYEKKYYYQIQKWIFNRNENSSGVDEYEFYWPKYNLEDNERISSKKESYILTFTTIEGNKKYKEYKAEVPESYLRKFKIGQEVDITVQGGYVTKINDESIIF